MKAASKRAQRKNFFTMPGNSFQLSALITLRVFEPRRHSL